MNVTFKSMMLIVSLIMVVGSAWLMVVGMPLEAVAGIALFVWANNISEAAKRGEYD